MFNNQCKLGLSNIPGPTKKIVFWEDMTVESIIPACTSARALPYIPLVSYNGEFRFCMTIDESIDVEPKKFIHCIESIIENLS